MKSDRKKILFVINSMECGGAEKSLLSLLSAFDYSKYDVSLRLLNKTGMLLGRIPPQVNLLPEIDFFAFLKKSPLGQVTVLKPKFLLSRLKLHRKLKNNRAADFKLHDSQVFWQVCAECIEESRECFYAAVAWGQGNPTHYVADKVNAYKKIAWINADYKAVGYDEGFDRKYYEKFNTVVAVSEKLKLKMKSVFPEFSDKLTFVSDIQNYDYIRKTAKSGGIMAKNAASRLVTVGRMAESKNYILAVETAALLAKDACDFEWIFVGDGPQRQSVEEKIKEYGLRDKVMLVGLQSNPYPYIASADIYVQTSSSEGYCLTLAEARMLNVPSVSTNFDVVYEQIADGENGLITEMTPRAVYCAVKRLLSDDRLYAYIKANLEKEKKGNTDEVYKVYGIIEND